MTAPPALAKRGNGVEFLVDDQIRDEDQSNSEINARQQKKHDAGKKGRTEQQRTPDRLRIAALEGHGDLVEFHGFTASGNQQRVGGAKTHRADQKYLKKERQKVTDAGITFIRLEGNEISNALWNDFYTFYQSTYMMRGMQGYLSVEFFLEVAQTMPEQLFMVCAQQGDNTIATALFFKGSQNLYGRYWGSAADYQFLHFETCYYQGQEYAIEHGFKLFDSGAQGEHKIQRGFEPVITYSNHWIADEAFRDAIARFLEEEKPHIERYRNEARSLLPFKSESVDLSKKP